MNIARAPRRRVFAGFFVILALAVSPATGGAPGAPATGLVPGQLLVRFKAGTSPAMRTSALLRVGAHRTGSVAGIDVDIVAVVAGREHSALAALRSDYRVAYAEQEVVYRVATTTPTDPLWSTEVGLQEISAPQAWDLTRGSAATVVAVLDSGVDFTHPDLAGAAVAGYDFVNGDEDAADDYGHGTSVAGVIAARADAQGMAGLCWQCSIMPVKVLDGLGNGTSATLAAGLVWAADHGARVINMSLSGPANSAALADAVRYAADRGAVLVGSAGNDASTQPTYPAAYPEVIGVAASTPARTLYGFSNRGDWVRIAAPGCNTATFLLGSFVYFCGTSSAAPVVSGVAALALSLRSGVTRSVVAKALEDSATPLAEAGVRSGRVDAYGTLLAINTALGSPAGGTAPSGQPAASAPPPQAPVETGSAVTAPPRALRGPSIVGRARMGRRLRVRAGTWAGSQPIVLHYRWLRCRSATGRCRLVSGATGVRYRISRRDRGLRLRVAVTATNFAGSTVQTSKPTRRVPRG